MTSKTKPAVSVAAITPSDATIYNPPFRAIYIGVDGNVAVVCPDDSTAVFVNLLAGSDLIVECKQVLATGTTATNIIGYR